MPLLYLFAFGYMFLMQPGREVVLFNINGPFRDSFGQAGGKQVGRRIHLCKLSSDTCFSSEMTRMKTSCAVVQAARMSKVLGGQSRTSLVLQAPPLL